MPSLGADMQAGKLVEWLVKVGDRVNRGDTIAVVETDKSNVDIEVFQSGIVEQFIVQPGAKVPVGTVLATIRAEGETAAAAPPTAPAPAVPTPAARINASPMARKLARELGVDLGGVKGTGPHGVIQRADVEGAAAPVPAAPPVEALTGMRRAIAAAMARSNREIPHYYLGTRIDMHAALRWLEQFNARRPVKDRVLVAALLLKAVARALTEVPELNAYWVDDRPQPQERINVGVALSLRQGGLIIPAIHDTDAKSVEETMQAMSDLITRARSGRLKSSELADSTITVSNLGDLGVETVYGVIYPPQVALVGFGKIIEQPWAEDGMVGIRPVIAATLAADHRATDGHRGGQFLSALNQTLQEPDKL